VIHLDCVEGPHVELYCNLEHGIPLPSNSVDEVLAIDVLEHLRDIVAIVDEMHRVLVDKGRATIRVPQFGTYNHVTDPTHVRGFSEDSFDFFDDETPLGKGNGRIYTSRRWKMLNKEKAILNLLFTMAAIKPGGEKRRAL
jgi:SAM-dependent methyltransferase